MTIGLKEASKRVYGASPSPTHHELQTGCLMRIAEALETVAARYQSLLNDVQMYKNWYKEETEKRKALERKNSALRGQITKLKAKQ